MISCELLNQNVLTWSDFDLTCSLWIVLWWGCEAIVSLGTNRKAGQIRTKPTLTLDKSRKGKSPLKAFA